jgi:hypothetical protein
MIIYTKNRCYNKNELSCPYCVSLCSPYNLKLLKKVNQSKYVFKCLDCDAVFKITIKDHTTICNKCLDKPNNFSSFLNLCEECNGTRTINWLDKVFGKKKNDNIKYFEIFSRHNGSWPNTNTFTIDFECEKSLYVTRVLKEDEK